MPLSAYLSIRSGPVLAGVLWGLVGLSGCGSPQQKAVVVTPTLVGTPRAAVKSLVALPLLDGQAPTQVGEVIPAAMTPFTLVLPPDKTGLFTVDLEALGTSGIDALAVGHGEVVLDERIDYSLTIPLTAQTCTTGRWCWIDPTSQIGNLRSAWGVHGRDLWLVGAGGLILHRSPYAWTVSDSGVSNDLRAIWGSGPQDVWAVGARGAAVHFDGRRWTRFDTGGTAELRGVWVSDEGDVFAAGATGEGGALLRLQNGVWVAQAAGLLRAGLNGVWGSSASDVWAVGDGGLVLHYDGSRWSDQSLATTASLYAIWGSGPKDLWVPAQSGVFRFQGSWGPLTPQPNGTVTSVSGTGPGDVWLAGSALNLNRWNGQSLEQVPVEAETGQGVLALGPDDVWFVGDSGLILHWNGAKWRAPADEALQR